MDAEDENRPQLPEEPVASSSFSSIWNTSTPAEAIQLALSQQKLFLVWISPSTSDPAWDAIWTSPAIQSILAEHAVAITLAQGTPEAGMFLQLLASPPTATGVWIVFSGQLLDSFTEPPSSAEDMLQRINTTISKSQALKSAAFPPPYQPPASTSTSQQPPQSPTSTVSPEVAAQLAARRAKLEAAKLQYDKLEKERLRLAAARQAESADPERQKYITQTAKERAQKKLEKEKILQEIENDKLERKKQQQQQHRTSTPTTPTKAHTPPPTTGKTKVAVRLPDSRILRGEFEGVKTLADVRAWIDETRKEPSAPPYVLQTTFPTRTFEVSEEHTETLSSILGKGGQVVLKEIKTYSEAYAPPPGVVSMASSLLGSVTGTISNVLGWTAPAPPVATEEPRGQGVPGEAIREARIRNVNYSARERGIVEGDNGEGERERNWFNGNGLAQEAPPTRKEDEGKKD